MHTDIPPDADRAESPFGSPGFGAPLPDPLARSAVDSSITPRRSRTVYTTPWQETE